MPRTKKDTEKELKEKLQQEADAHIAQLKHSSERALKRKNRKIRRLYIVSAALAAVLVVGAVTGGFAYKHVKDENKRLSNPQEAAKLETDRIKKEVAALIEVPSDEEPTIANVSDANKAKQQSPTFFAKAQNNDRLLMYPKAKKAILYRPNEKRIIEVSTLNIGNGTQNSTAAPAPTGTTQTTPATNP